VVDVNKCKFPHLDSSSQCGAIFLYCWTISTLHSIKILHFRFFGGHCRPCGITSQYSTLHFQQCQKMETYLSLFIYFITSSRELPLYFNL